jgi:hypothetical protein
MGNILGFGDPPMGVKKMVKTVTPTPNKKVLPAAIKAAIKSAPKGGGNVFAQTGKTQFTKVVPAKRVIQPAKNNTPVYNIKKPQPVKQFVPTKKTVVPGILPGGGRVVLPALPMVKKSDVEAVKKIVTENPTVSPVTPVYNTMPVQEIPPQDFDRIRKPSVIEKATPTQRSFAPVDLPYIEAKNTFVRKDKTSPYKLPIDISLIVPAVDAGNGKYYGK